MGMKILFLYENLLKSVCISYSFNIPDSLHQLFVMDSLSFVWNEQIRSYVADGGFYIVAMKGKPIGKNVKIKMELFRSRSGNQYFMYIYDDNMWYYFEHFVRSRRRNGFLNELRINKYIL